MGLHLVMYATPPGAKTHRLDARTVGADFELLHDVHHPPGQHGHAGLAAC